MDIRPFRISLFTLICASTLLACSNDSHRSDSQKAEPVVREPAVPEQSSQVLEEYLKSGLTASESSRAEVEFDGITMAPDAAEADSSSDFTGTSQTNTQEQGVDELNWVKNDGSYIYAYNWRVDEPAGISLDEEFCYGCYWQQRGEVKVYAMQGDQPGASLINTIGLEGNVEGLYLSDQDSSNRSRQLAVVASGSFDASAQTQKRDWRYWTWRQQGIDIDLYDISTPEGQINKDHQITVEGSLVSSRRIADKLYVISRFTPYIEGVDPYPYRTEQVQANQSVLADIELQTLLPRIRIDGENHALVTADDCYVPESVESGTPTLLTVTAIDLANPGQYTAVCLAGYAQTVYVSEDNVFVATASWHNSIAFATVADVLVADVLEDSDTDSKAENTVMTNSHRFELTQQGPVYRGEGSVSGNIDWNGSFRLSEYKGHLRVVTSEWQWSTGDQLHRVHTLAINEKNLELLATIPNKDQAARIGKPGERIYSTRFFNERVYIVTFEQIDPFYVIDLKDPATPAILGELEMPGYSSYLQPIGDKLVLGIGKEVDGGIMKGVKIGLFDI